MKKSEERKEKTEMRILHWIRGISWKKKRNVDIRKCIDRANVAEECREAKFRRLGQVLRKEEESVREAFELAVTGKRKRGRQKLRWSYVIRNDLEVKYLH